MLVIHMRPQRTDSVRRIDMILIFLHVLSYFALDCKVNTFLHSHQILSKNLTSAKGYSYSHVEAFLKEDEKNRENCCDVKKNVYLCHIK